MNKIKTFSKTNQSFINLNPESKLKEALKTTLKRRNPNFSFSGPIFHKEM
jgi:hypothetical protein